MSWRTPPTCWAAEEAAKIIPVEAEAVPESFFDATHVPLRMTRVRPTDLRPTDAEPAVEQDLLSAVVEASGTVILPVLGDAGVGKSHLVRWLRNQLVRDLPEGLRVVFVPKHRTSLYGVVDLVLKEFEGEDALAEMRERLATARDTDASAEEQRERLRDALCTGLRFHPDRTSVSAQQSEVRDYLGAQLPALLRDPHFANRYLEPGSAIDRLVEEKREGRRGDDALEGAFEFRVEDVNLSFDDVSQAAASARAVANLLASQQEVGGVNIAELAAQMLNDQLPAALREVFGIGGDDLRDLFVEIRSILHGQQDLVLLAEDFSMFQGLQGGLIDAVTLHSTPAEQLCDLRTVVAVTTGYYRDHIPETFKTRADAAFIVAEQHPETEHRFVAAYLAAIRAGHEELDDAYAEGRAVKSVCEDCPVQERCHDAFGEIHGEGLFPFNEVALERARLAVLGAKFNARGVLTRVLRPVLVEDHDAIRAGNFPTPAFAERFDVQRHAPPAQDELILKEAGDAERRIALTAMYAREPSAADLAETIHDAFSVPPRGVGERRQTRQVVEDREGYDQSRRPETPIPSEPKSPALVGALEAWRRGSVLSQSDRRDLRKLVHRAVGAQIDFNDGAYRSSEWQETSMPPAFVETSVVVDDNRPSTPGLVLIELQHDRAEHVYAAQSLAWLDDRGSWRDVPDGTERAAALWSVLDGWAATVRAGLGLDDEPDEEFTFILAALEVTAAFLGDRPLGGTGTVDDRLTRIYRQEKKSGRWEGLEAETESLGTRSSGDLEALMRALLRSTAYAQGDRGSPAAVNLRLLRRALPARVHLDLSFSTESRKLKGAVQAVVALVKRLDQYKEAMRTAAPDLELLGEDDIGQLAVDIGEVAAQAQVEAATVTALQEAGSRVRPSDTATVRTALGMMDGWDDLDHVERAGLVGGPWWAAAERLNAFIELAQVALDRAAPEGAISVQDEEVAEIGSRWRDALGRAHRLLETASEGAT